MGKVLDILNFRERLLTTVPALEASEASEPRVDPAEPDTVPIHAEGPAAGDPAAEEIPFIEVPDTDVPTGTPVAAPVALGLEHVAFEAATKPGARYPNGFAAELIVARAPDSPAAGHYRKAADALRCRLVAERARTLLFAPAGTADDCSVPPANLALALAGDQRVLLVDADLRARRAAILFGLSAMPGWGDLLVGVEPPRAIQDSGWPGLHVISAGNRLVAAHSAFRAERIRRLLGRLRASYDLLLVKSPVWDEFHAPAALAQACDAVCLLVARNQAGRAMELRCAEWLREEGVRLLGSILLPA